VIYGVVLSANARANLKVITDGRHRKLIVARIEELAAAPLQLGEPLVAELHVYRSIRAVGQRYRILYRVDNTQVLIIVVAIGLRRDDSPEDVYKEAPRLALRGPRETL